MIVKIWLEESKSLGNSSALGSPITEISDANTPPGDTTLQMINEDDSPDSDNGNEEEESKANGAGSEIGGDPAPVASEGDDDPNLRDPTDEELM